MIACNDSMGIEAQEEHVSGQGMGGSGKEGGGEAARKASPGETVLGENGLS